MDKDGRDRSLDKGEGQSGRPRAREFGWPFEGDPGPWNAITDVPGVEVGYQTLIDGEGPLQRGVGPVRTGVTAILPRGRSGVGRPVAAGCSVLNGNGEMTGTAWITETGLLDLPITLSDTHAVGNCHTGTIRWINTHYPDLARAWLLPVCAETWSGYLNDINGEHVTPEVVVAALDGARRGPLDEGSVGGGTGMNCYGFKGGSGTASRVVPFGDTAYTVGVFVQANFGSRHELTIGGVRIGDLLNVPNPMEDEDWLQADPATRVPGGSGSVIVIVATDAPLNGLQCQALSRRVPLGLARTGTTGSLFSGDLFLSFSVANDRPSETAFLSGSDSTEELIALIQLPWNRIDALHTATVQAVHEAVLNALVGADTMVGRDGHISYRLPAEEVLPLVRSTAAH